MNYYYVDTTVSTNGDGSKASPFKSFADAIGANMTHPFTLTLVDGQYEVLTSFLNVWSLVNTSGEMSYIKCGGTYSLKSTGNTILYGKVSWVTFSGIKFEHISGTETNPKCELSIIGDANNIGNVWFEYCYFVNSPNIVSNDKMFGVIMKGYDNPAGVAHKFGINNSHFIRTSAGAHMQGNTKPTASDDNRGDSLRSYGAQVKNVSFVDVKTDAVIFNGCASKNGDPSETVDEWTSYATNCVYSNKQYKSVDLFTNPFWFVNSKNCMFDECRVFHEQGTTNDKTAFDFDEGSWGCVLRDCYSYGAGGGFLLTSAWGVVYNGVDYDSSKYTDYDWYYTRQFGSGNHKVINCTSFNDGVKRGAVKLQGHIFNVSFQDVNIIRTDATEPNYDIFNESWVSHEESSLESNNMKICTFKNVNLIIPFYKPYTYINWASGWGDHAKLATAYVDFSDCNFLFLSGTVSGDFGAANQTNVNILSGATPFNNGSAWSTKESVDNAVNDLLGS